MAGRSLIVVSPPKTKNIDLYGIIFCIHLIRKTFGGFSGDRTEIRTKICPRRATIWPLGQNSGVCSSTLPLVNGVMHKTKKRD